jgi:hypothetical protein
VKAAKEACVKLHATIVKSVGRCENCGTTQALTCAHIVKRRYDKTLTLISNAICLCIWCHSYYEEHPTAFKAYISTLFGEHYYDNLYQMATQSMSKVDWEQRKKELRTLQQRLESGGIALEDLRGQAL